MVSRSGWETSLIRLLSRLLFLQKVLNQSFRIRGPLYLSCFRSSIPSSSLWGRAIERTFCKGLDTSSLAFLTTQGLCTRNTGRLKDSISGLLHRLGSVPFDTYHRRSTSVSLRFVLFGTFRGSSYGPCVIHESFNVDNDENTPMSQKVTEFLVVSVQVVPSASMRRSRCLSVVGGENKKGGDGEEGCSLLWWKLSQRIFIDSSWLHNTK